MEQRSASPLIQALSALRHAIQKRPGLAVEKLHVRRDRAAGTAAVQNPYSRSWLWIPGSRGACHRAAQSAAAQTARWFTPTGSIRRIHRRQAQEIFAEQACAKRQNC